VLQPEGPAMSATGRGGAQIDARGGTDTDPRGRVARRRRSPHLSGVLASRHHSDPGIRSGRFLIRNADQERLHRGTRRFR
jgi:hypothetical protein